MDYHPAAIRHLPSVNQVSAAPPTMTGGASASLSRTERAVIGLSLRDSIASISERRGWGPTIAAILGRRQPNRLANAALEELRRFSILARVHGGADTAMLRRLFDAGYTPAQADLVVRAINRHSSRDRAIGPILVGWLLVILATTGVYLVLRAVLEEPTISAIVTGLAFVTLASVTAPREQRSR